MMTSTKFFVRYIDGRLIRICDTKRKAQNFIKRLSLPGYSIEEVIFDGSLLF